MDNESEVLHDYKDGKTFEIKPDMDVCAFPKLHFLFTAAGNIYWMWDVGYCTSRKHHDSIIVAVYSHPHSNISHTRVEGTTICL